MENKQSILIITILTIIAIFAIPIGVNALMGRHFEGKTVYGNASTWIAFFGSYLGSILSGVITLVGVLLTIRYTQKQSLLSLSREEEQHKENMRFVQEENRREKLPEIINNIEECIDFVEEALEELEFLSRGDFEEILNVTRAEKKLKVFYINDAYHLAKTDKLVDLTKNYLKTIRNYTVKAATPAYEVFLRFSSYLKISYFLNYKCPRNGVYRFSNGNDEG
ncbi:hypothetical protein ACM6Q7_06915 [Peribacillus butanolivorans]|uniref:hypothetical protein n=1 Tax=Peribacillus butanolivorans TaxID=421767 RepID=UPI0039FCC216